MASAAESLTWACERPVPSHPEVADGNAGLQPQGEADVVPRAVTRLQHGRRDARGVRDAGRDVTGTHHHGEVELVRALVVLEHVHVRDLDEHLLARRDVAHGLGEDVGALLLEEAGGQALRQRGLVDVAGLRAAADQPHDAALAHHHAHVVHRGAVGEREDVEGFDGLVRRVDEPLGDLDARHEAGHVRLDVRVAERALDQAAGPGDAQRALGDVLLEVRGILGRRRDRQQAKKSRSNEPILHGRPLSLSLDSNRRLAIPCRALYRGGWDEIPGGELAVR
jgi:hypothetical protein